MARHNIKPRILEVAYRLRRFTVQELSHAAQVDRKSTYKQLGDLERGGYLTSERVDETVAHRPRKLYRLTEDPSKLRQLAGEIASYRPWELDARVAETAVSNVQTALLRVEGELNALDLRTKDVATIERSLRTLADLEPRLNDARVELETAVLETPPDITPERSPQHPVMIEMTRWRDVMSRRELIGQELKKREAELTQAELVRASIQVLDRVTAADWGKPAVRRALQKRVAFRPAVEALMDSLEEETGPRLLTLAHLVERALKTSDMDVLRQCLASSEPTGSRWWRFNRVTAEFLSSGFREQALVACWNEITSWVRSLRSGRKDVVKRPGKLGIYLCDLNSVTQQRYLSLAAGYRVSAITPRPLDFLVTAQETIGPTLVDVASAIIVGAGARLGPTDVRQLAFPFELERSAVWRLYGYGPVASRIRLWPGAPAIRIAGSLCMLGVPPKKVEKAMIALSTDQKGLVLVESTRTSPHSEISDRVRSVIGTVEEVAVF